jgi:hypothetical protein
LGVGSKTNRTWFLGVCSAIWFFQDLCGCEPPKIWLKNQISKGFGYNNLALGGTLAWVLGKTWNVGLGQEIVRLGYGTEGQVQVSKPKNK